LEGVETVTPVAKAKVVRKVRERHKCILRINGEAPNLKWTEVAGLSRVSKVYSTAFYSSRLMPYVRAVFFSGTYVE
jgi:hypothetical protein